jgi:hypothetical protein
VPPPVTAFSHFLFSLLFSNLLPIPGGITRSFAAPARYGEGEKEITMAATVTGSKTVTRDVSPAATAAVLTALLATPIESLTVKQFELLEDALRKISQGHAPGATIGSLFK